MSDFFKSRFAEPTLEVGALDGDIPISSPGDDNSWRGDNNDNEFLN